MSISISGLNTQLAGKLSSTGPSTITKDAHVANSSNVHLELYSAMGTAANEVSLRFHQAGRWWGQIRATASGFTFTEGGDGTLRNITAGLATLTSAGIATSAPETALHVAGTSTLQTTVEVVVQKTGATGVVVHDYATGSVFLHSSISGNFTCNITNPPAYNDRAYVVSLILVQGATPRRCTALQIDGVAQPINWFGGTVPTGTASKRDVVSFSIIRTAAAYTVLGQNATFG